MLVLGTAVVPASITIASAQPAAHMRDRLEMPPPQSVLASMAATYTAQLQSVGRDSARQTAIAPVLGSAPRPASEPRSAPEAAPEPAPAVVTATLAAAPAPGGAHGNFPRGYCTWYVSTRRNIPWTGDAGAWYAAAKALGFPVGATPQPGAIMVSRESWIGHVAFVESVDGDSFTISEMNYRGFGIVDQRRVTLGHIPLIGFIY